MRSFLVILICLLLSSPATSGPKEDVHETITLQLEAFLDDDFVRAFTYASSSIRTMFQTPENFGNMVRNGYPMVWRPEKFTFLEHRKNAGGRSQDIQILDQDGEIHYLRYYLMNTSDGWKISGVQFLDPSDYSA